MKKSWMLYALVLVLSIGFAGGCGGGGEFIPEPGITPTPEPTPMPTPHKYERYGVVEKENRIWYWIGVNETFTADASDAVFTEDGEEVEGALEKGKSYYFVDEKEFFYFIPKNQEELGVLHLPNQPLLEGKEYRWGKLGPLVKLVLPWKVGKSEEIHLMVSDVGGIWIKESLRLIRPGSILWPGREIEIQVRHGKPIHELYWLGDVTKVEGRESWYKLVRPKGCEPLGFPTDLMSGNYVITEDAEQFVVPSLYGFDTRFGPGTYFFIEKEKYNNFAPTTESGIYELYHPLVQHNHLLADWRVGGERGTPLVRVRGYDHYAPIGAMLYKGDVIDWAVVLPKDNPWPIRNFLPSPNTISHELSYLGIVEGVNELWFSLGCNQAEEGLNPAYYFFCEYGERVERLEKGRKYYFLNKEVYYNFRIEKEEEVRVLEHPKRQKQFRFEKVSAVLRSEWRSNFHPDLILHYVNEHPMQTQHRLKFGQLLKEGVRVCVSSVR